MVLKERAISHKAAAHFWQALRHPARAVEVRAFLQRQPHLIKHTRGAQWQESALHWAVFFDVGTVLDALGTGLDINALDNLGRTPLDWLNDRLYATCALSRGAYDLTARYHLCQHAETIVPVVWRQGGRPGTSVNSLHVGRCWMASGAFDLMPLWKQESTHWPWHGWPSQDSTVLHAWVLAPEGARKTRWLDTFLAQEPDWDINEGDMNGRTALWYAYDAVLSCPEQAARYLHAAQVLLEHGADGSQQDAYGVTPFEKRDARSVVEHLPV